MKPQVIIDEFLDFTDNAIDEIATRLFNSLSNEIFLIDSVNYTLVRANRGALKGCGYQLSDLQERPLWDLAPEMTESKCQNIFSALIKGDREVIQTSTVFRRKDGSSYPVSLKCQYFENICPPVIVATAQDETEKRETEDLNIRLGRIIDSSLNEIYIFDGETCKFVHVNEGARRNLGYSMSEMKALTAWDIKPGIEEQEFRSLVMPLLKEEKEVLQFETIHQRKDGSRYPVEVHLQLFADETPPVFVAIIMDVSERKASQTAVFKSQQVLSKAQQIAHIGSWQWEIQSGTLDWSDEIFRIFGFDPKSIVPTYDKFLDIVHPDDRAEVENAVQKALDEKQPYSIEHRLIRPDSELRWVHEQGEASYAEDGTPLAMLGTVLDITERKRVEDLNNRFGRIFETSLNEIYIFDREAYKFVYVNEGARRNLGYSMDEMEALTAWDIKPEIDGPQFKDIVQSLIDKEEEILQFETVHQRKNGTCYPVEVHLQLFTDETPSVFVAIIMDISERKEVEEAILKLNQDLEGRVEQRTEELQQANEELSSTLEDLKQMQGQLVESEKMASLGGLVAGVAHEINTPIGIGVTAVSHLKDENEKLRKAYFQNSMKRSDLEAYVKQSGEVVTIIETNLSRASNLIRSFKNVAVDQTSEEPRNFVLAEYLEEILLSLHPKLKQLNHNVKLDCDPSIRICGQPGVLSQIITNLVMNSLIHAFDEGERGEMSLSAHQIADKIEICYRDFGKGIPKGQISKVFEPFYTTRRGQGGSGLGLHIIYNLVTQKLGGTIECESEFGRGTSFTIKYPAN